MSETVLKLLSPVRLQASKQAEITKLQEEITKVKLSDHLKLAGHIID